MGEACHKQPVPDLVRTAEPITSGGMLCNTAYNNVKPPQKKEEPAAKRWK